MGDTPHGWRTDAVPNGLQVFAQVSDRAMVIARGAPGGILAALQGMQSRERIVCRVFVAMTMRYVGRAVIGAMACGGFLMWSGFWPFVAGFAVVGAAAVLVTWRDG